MSGVMKRFLEGPATSAGIASGHRLLLALGATWRIRHTGREHIDAVRRDGTPVLYGLMHGVLLPLVYTHRDRAIQVLVSDSRDGEIIARVIHNLGFGTARGSTTRGGGKGALRLARMGRDGYDLGVTPDGPRGPRGSVQPGIVFVAARSGVPIVPMGVAADRAWRLRSWDRFLVPKPGARVVVNYQPAIRVAPDADQDGVAEIVRDAIARAEAVATEHAIGAVPAGATRFPG